MSESTKPSTKAKSTEESAMKSESKKKKFYVGMKRESVTLVLVTVTSKVRSEARSLSLRWVTEAENMVENAIEGLDSLYSKRKCRL